MATIAENLQILKDSADAIKQAIIDKGGKITGGITTYADSISKISTKEDNVVFYDYDGTILCSYTKNKFLSLTSLPILPSHPGLICQGWNWTLEDAKTYVQEYERLDIGATYITDDNKTRLYINLLNDGRNVPIYINQTVENSVIVDWGDGTNTETTSDTGNIIFNHAYNEAGSYIITLTVNSGTCKLGHDDPSYNVMGPTNTIASGFLYKVEIGSNMNIGMGAFYLCLSLTSITIPNFVTNIGMGAFNVTALTFVIFPNSVTSIEGAIFGWCASLTSIIIPNSVTSIGDLAFYGCAALTSLIIPNSVTSIGVGAFGESSLTSITIPSSVNNINMEDTFFGCHSLKSITIPNSVTSVENRAFWDCESLASITIPNSVTSIGNGAFRYCTSLTFVIFPNSVTSIGSEAFYGCSNIQYYDFTSHTSIPTLSNTDVFGSISMGCEIRVPAALYEEWKTATNWSVYADYIVPYEG